MGPSGAMAWEKSSSRPLSQSWSWITTLGASSCAQLASNIAIRMSLDMDDPPSSQAKKSPELQIGQRRTGHRVEQRPAPLGTVDRPGHFEDRADAPLPRLVELVEELFRARHILRARSRGAGDAAGGFEPDRRAPETARQAERGHAFLARMAQRIAGDERRL